MNPLSRPLPPEVPCPQCRRRGAWLAGPSGPFCSERCRLLDLGGWLDETRRICRELRPGDFEGFDELPPDRNPDR
ncbi:MAG: DNA gyrase inhibitor YacG [Verrucomicrobia bacterium]|nr:DNA gyrase inhibitor YacG [Verrucomicrobiota bacterium]